MNRAVLAAPMSIVVFTDLDGTLLDHATYSFDAARPALDRLKRQNIPVVFCTSKTRAEVEVWRRALENQHPFIVENGGAIFLPREHFPFATDHQKFIQRDPYLAIEFGDPYSELVRVLQMASRQSACRVLGFHAMTPEELSRRAGLALEEAILAKQREYDEPFEILDQRGADRLLLSIERLGKRWTRGGRYFHVLGKNDKQTAVRRLAELYRQLYGEVQTIGLGDGLNDAEFLNAVDTPILIRSRLVEELHAAVPHGRLTARSGPDGWNEAILEVIPL